MKRLLMIIPILLLLAGCGQKTERKTVSFFAMDTIMEVSVYGDDSVLTDAEALVKQLDSELSATNGDIARLNDAKVSFREYKDGSSSCIRYEVKSLELSENAVALIREAKKLCEKTYGALDISVYPLVELWGFDSGNFRVPSDAEIASALKGVDHQNITAGSGDNSVTIPWNAKIGLGAIAKGYTGDMVIAMLRNNGVKSALINLGGNVQTLGTKPDGSLWRIGIADPNEPAKTLGYVKVGEAAVVTSGGYQRYFEQDGKKYIHILDPKTGKPVENSFLSVTVVGPSGLVCDAYSTALFVMGPEKAREFIAGEQGYEAVFVLEGGTIEVTEGLKNSFVKE